MKKIYRRLLNLFLVASILIGGTSACAVVSDQPNTRSNETKVVEVNLNGTTNASEMEVHFMDVGQGDSTLIMCDGHSMLIDAGDYSKGTAIQNYLQKQNVQKLDYLILTHPDSDHIGGAPVIITKFDIDKVFVSNYEKDNKTYEKLIQALDNKRLKYTTPEVGAKYSLGTAQITILAPNAVYKNPNDASIALMLQNGENKFLFTGDAGEDAEQDMLASGIDLSADVYKAGHHGSRTSSSQSFVEKVNPSSAVISCGEDNSYGHPHAETLNTFRMNGIEVYRTDEEGTIIATSDGEKITFSVPSSDSWKSGEPSGNSSVWEPSMQTSGNQESKQVTDNESTDAVTYILNTNTKKFHRPSCGSLPTTNREDSTATREEIIAQGYEPCGSCNP